MHGYTTWIGEVGLGHWGRSGLSGDVAVEEGFGGVSKLTHDKPNIVLSNHVAQVKRQPRISWTESRECGLYFCASRIIPQVKNF